VFLTIRPGLLVERVDNFETAAAVYFLDADGVAGRTGPQIDLLAVDARAAAASDDDLC
jgi:hypothetical protein